MMKRMGLMIFSCVLLLVGTGVYGSTVSVDSVFSSPISPVPRPTPTTCHEGLTWEQCYGVEPTPVPLTSEEPTPVPLNSTHTNVAESATTDKTLTDILIEVLELWRNW